MSWELTKTLNPTLVEIGFEVLTYGLKLYATAAGRTAIGWLIAPCLSDSGTACRIAPVPSWLHIPLNNFS